MNMIYETDLEECKSRMLFNSDLNLGIDDTGWLFSLSIMQVIIHKCKLYKTPL